MVSKWLGVAGTVVVFAGALMLTASPAKAEDPSCFECHDDFPQKMKGFAVQHEPAAGGECTACHLDHGDEERLMLVKEGAALCYECHDNMASGTSVHAPVANGTCTECHDPHGSASKNLLVASPTKLCEKCHAGSNPEFSRKVLHTALDDGCSECHKSHNSAYPKLLAKSLVRERLALFEPSQAELCFACHDAGTFTAAQSGDTGFRTGQTNLHSLHLLGQAKPNKYGITKRQEGQTCFACHLPHSSDQEMLVRSLFQCAGTPCFTMQYVKNEQGGSCVVGCHKPKTYSRDGRNPDSTARAASDAPAVP